MVRFTIPNHNQVVLSSLMKEIGLRSTPSLVFNLHVVSHPLSSSLPSSASSSNSSISAETVCQLHSSNGQQVISNNGSYSSSSSSPPVLMGNNNTSGSLLRILTPRSGSTSPSSRDCSSPLGYGRTHILKNIPEWVLVTFSGYFRDQVSKVRPKPCFRDEDEEEEDEGVTREGYETEFLHPITLSVSGVPFPILKLIIDMLSQGSVDVPFTKVDDMRDGLKRLEILNYAVQDMEAKETRRRIALNPGMKPSRVFRSKSVSHMMFPIRESIEAD